MTRGIGYFNDGHGRRAALMPRPAAVALGEKLSRKTGRNREANDVPSPSLPDVSPNPRQKIFSGKKQLWKAEAQPAQRRVEVPRKSGPEDGKGHRGPLRGQTRCGVGHQNRRDGGRPIQSPSSQTKNRYRQKASLQGELSLRAKTEELVRHRN